MSSERAREIEREFTEKHGDSDNPGLVSDMAERIFEREQALAVCRIGAHELGRRIAELERAEWATQICSAHQQPDPLCRTCNPEIARLERQLAEARKRENNLRMWMRQTQRWAQSLTPGNIEAQKVADEMRDGLEADEQGGGE